MRAQVWDVPPAWSLLDAATVPVAYLTAYYALVMRGRLQRGQRVLIHSGTGAVGLAAIRIARFRGCEARELHCPQAQTLKPQALNLWLYKEPLSMSRRGRLLHDGLQAVWQHLHLQLQAF